MVTEHSQQGPIRKGERVFAQSLQCSVYWVPDRAGQAVSGNVEMDNRNREAVPVVDSLTSQTNHLNIIMTKIHQIKNTP